ncbi:hypothetical protein GCM10027347_59000 [Larkinella harenae]
MEFKASDANNKALLKAMQKLPRTIRNRALRKGLRAGAEVVKKRASDNVRSVTSDEATGLLASKLVIRARKQTRTALGVRVAIGRGTAKNGARIGLYGSVLEFGKENQPPRPWLRPAADQSASQVLSVLVQESSRYLDDAVEDAKRGT